MYIANNQAYQQIGASLPSESVRSATSQSILDDAMNGRSDSTSGKTLSISDQAKRLSESESVYTLNTGAGDKQYDLDSYFDPQAQASSSLLSLDGLLLPSSQNVSALQDHISKVFPDFLSRNNIPEAPSSIQYDGEGKIVLPADYPYADQLKQALTDDPAMAKELSTVNALSSHLAALKSLEPFHEEYDSAQSQAEIDAIIDKYSYLFGDNRTYPQVQLSFDQEGHVSVQSDGKALV
jgi:hypothetical protein